MHAHTNMEMTFSKGIDNELRQSIQDTIAEAANDVDVECHADGLEYDESYRLVWLEDIVEVACKLARMCKGKTSFSMRGTIDVSESNGEYMDYVIDFRDDTLYSSNSVWYLNYCGTDMWDGYEEFCEVFDKKEDIASGKHTYSEEFFNALKRNFEWYSTSGFGRKHEIWLDGVHMGKPKVVDYEKREE